MSDRPNFVVVEGGEPDVDYESFKMDFINPQTYVLELRHKYNLSPSKYRELRDKVLDETGLPKKPYKNNPIWKYSKTGHKFIQKKDNGWLVIKRKGGRHLYYGRFKDLDTALMVRERMIEADWNYDLGRYLNDKYGAKQFRPTYDKAKEFYPKYKDLYMNSNLPILDILDMYGITQKMYHYLTHMLREEGIRRRFPRREVKA